jgi:hypothetical protein
MVTTQLTRCLLVVVSLVLLCGSAAAQRATGRQGDSPLDRQPSARKDKESTRKEKKDKDEPLEIEADEPPPPTQKYEKLPVDDKLRTNSHTIDAILRAGKFGSGEQATFDDYYEKFFLAQWTDPKNVTNLPRLLKDMRTSHLGKKAAASDVHDHLNKLVLDFMKKVALGPYHPASQINAMLMIGNLNAVEQQPSTPTPTPLPEALTVMTEAATDAKVADAVRVAALVGIQRHVAAKIADQEVRKKLTGSLLEIAKDDLPDGAQRAGREWLLAQALETLGNLGSPGEGNAVFKAMGKAMADQKLRFSTRCIAAEAMGRLNYANAAGINAVQTAAAVGQFALDTCGDVSQLLKDGDPPVSRRRLKQGVSSALLAIVGDGDAEHKGIISLAKEPEQQEYVAGLQKALTKATEFLDDKKNDDEKLDDPLEKLQGELESLLKKKPK